MLVAIDPSVNNLGWASYDVNLGQNLYDIDSGAWKFGLIHPKSGGRQEMPYKWRDAFYKLKVALEGGWPTHMAAEWPNFFSGYRGKIAAMRGHTLGLAGQVGYIAGRFGLRAEAVLLCSPQQWKGSVPKRVTQAKFLRLFGPEKAALHVVRNYSDDTIDAIMIAEYWLSLWNRGKINLTPVKRRHEYDARGTVHSYEADDVVDKEEAKGG
jgi:hypothetical protein